MKLSFVFPVYPKRRAAQTNPPPIAEQHDYIIAASRSFLKRFYRFFRIFS